MKHLVVIVEGIEPTTLRHEMTAGRLPWFSKTVEEGRWWDIDCGPVPYEPSNLATAFSGQGPGEHGCFSYWAIRNGGRLPSVLETADVGAKRFWEWPEFSDIRVSIVNVQLTHPPAPLNGNLISYPMLATLRASHPKDLLAGLSRRGIRYAHDVTVFYTGQKKEDFANEAIRAAGYQLDTALALADDCDLMTLNITLPDRLSHFLWRELEVPEADRGGARPYVLRAYDFADRACALLQEKVTQSMTVFSEIGFGGLDGFVSLDAMLQRIGLQYLGEDGSVDMKRSLAYEAVQGSHGVILARGASTRAGEAQAAADYEIVREALSGFRFEDGSPVLGAVRHREEVYSGPRVHYAPDIIVKPADPRRPPLGDPRWANHVRRSDQTGWHRDRGFLIVNGAPSSSYREGGDASLENIAPTIARLVGVDVPAACKASALIA